jgi:hypothetical protein
MMVAKATIGCPMINTKLLHKGMQLYQSHQNCGLYVTWCWPGNTSLKKPKRFLYSKLHEKQLDSMSPMKRGKGCK